MLDNWWRLIRGGLTPVGPSWSTSGTTCRSLGTSRRAVDAGAAPGQFLLTGSMSALNPGTHSGAGRIVTVRMRPMALCERGVGERACRSPSSSRDIAEVGGETDVDLERYVDEVARSGFRTSGRRPTGFVVHSCGYLQRVIDRDFPDIRAAGSATLRRCASGWRPTPPLPPP
ncbi:MAG: hypothetical protein R2749_17600 [Acidimicrobiales bacterium]